MHLQVEKLQTWQHLVLGGVSGAVAASATMPLDVAKTSLQCGPAGGGGGVGQIFSQIVKEKGAQGLFAGMVSFPLCTIYPGFPTLHSLAFQIAHAPSGTLSHTCNIVP